MGSFGSTKRLLSGDTRRFGLAKQDIGYRRHQDFMASNEKQP